MSSFLGVPIIGLDGVVGVGVLLSVGQEHFAFWCAFPQAVRERSQVFEKKTCSIFCTKLDLFLVNWVFLVDLRYTCPIVPIY